MVKLMQQSTNITNPNPENLNSKQNVNYMGWLNVIYNIRKTSKNIVTENPTQNFNSNNII